MKTNPLLILFILLAMTACKNTPEMAPDKEAEKASIDSLFTAFFSALDKRDIPALSTFVSEDMLGMGTDPSEKFTKQQMVEIWQSMLADSTLEIRHAGDMDIKFTDEGNSAIVVEQYKMPQFTPHIPWRTVYVLEKREGKWIITFYSTAFIPRNEDIPKLNKALE